MPKEKLLWDFLLEVDGKIICKLTKTTPRLPADWKDLEHKQVIVITKSYRRFE